MLRTLARLLVFLMVLLVLIAVLVGAGAWLGPPRVTEVLVSNAALDGVELSLSPLELSTSGELQAATFTLNTRGVTLACDELRVRPVWRSLFSVERAALVQVGSCTLSAAESNQVRSTNTIGPEDADVDPVAELNAQLDRLWRRVDRIEVGSLEILEPRGPGSRATLESISSDSETTSAQWSASASGWRAAGTLVQVEGGWRVQPTEIRPPFAALCGDRCPAVSVDEINFSEGPTLRVQTVSAALGGLSISMRELESARAPEGGTRSTRVSGLHISAPPNSVYGPLSALFAAIGGEAPPEGPPSAEGDEDPDAPWLVAPHAKARRAMQALETAVALVPEGRLPAVEMRDTHVSVGILRSIALPNVAFGDAPSAFDGWQLIADGERVELRSPPGTPPALSVRVARGEVVIHADLAGMTLQHPGLASEAITLPESALTLTWSNDLPTRVRLSGVWSTLPFDGHLNISEDGIELSLAASSVWDCQRLWRSVPPPMLTQLTHDDIQLTGSLTPSLLLRIPVGDLSSLELDIEGVPGNCVPTYIAEQWDPAQLNNATYQMTPSADVMPTPRPLGPASADYVPLGRLPGYVPALMYLSEEINFPTNDGFSEGLVARGLRANLQEGRYVYGGSTVSQQLVKNLFLRREKTIGRKVEEAMLTWLMERAVPKWRILELYLNMVEFGPDVWGIAQASWHYIGRPANELTPLEAAFLAALKPAPREGNVYRRRGNSPLVGWWPERLQTLLARLHEHGEFLTEKEARAFAPYVVALRRDEAVIGETGPVLGNEDGSVVRIDVRPTGAPAAWWSLQGAPAAP